MDRFLQCSFGLGKFLIGLLTSWPLLIGLGLLFFRTQFIALLKALTEKIEKSTSIKFPGIELSQTSETVASLAKDVLDLKQQLPVPELASGIKAAVRADEDQETLESLAKEYNEKTNVPSYAERMLLKTKIFNRMVEIARLKVPSPSQFLNASNEGALLAAVATTVVLPPPEGFKVLVTAGELSKHLFVRNTLLFRFVEMLEKERSAPYPDLVAARDLVDRYESDSLTPPDATFRRNLTYYRQLIDRYIQRVGGRIRHNR